MSWSSGYLRIGLLVLYVHDVSDIFVDVLKLCNYLKLEGARCFFVTEVAYVSCVAGWMYWRLYQYPFRVIYGSYTGMMGVTAFSARSPHVILGIPVMTHDMPLLIELFVLLGTLAVLHVYWFHLFLMIGWRLMTESVREVSRAEYEGDSDDDSSAPAAPALAGTSSVSAVAASGSSAGRRK